MDESKEVIEDCRYYVKPFYTVEEAAYSWCGFTDYEYRELLDSIVSQDEMTPPGFTYEDVKSCGIEKKKDFFTEMLGYGAFPILHDYPCFKLRVEHLAWAIENGEIPHSREGRVISNNDHVSRQKRTVSAKDLKKWLIEFHPNEKPAFIFNQLERKELLNAEKLLIENDRLNQQVHELESSLKLGRIEYKKLLDKVKVLSNDQKEAAPKTKNIHLELIQLFAGEMLRNGLSENPHTDSAQLIKKISIIKKPCLVVKRLWRSILGLTGYNYSI